MYRSLLRSSSAASIHPSRRSLLFARIPPLLCPRHAHHRPLSPPTTITVWASSFHSTPKAQSLPLILASVFKTSTALEMTRTAARITLTFVPFLFLSNYKSRKWLKYLAKHDKPDAEEKKTYILKKIRHRTIVFHILLFIPAVLFCSTIVASLERTPLTGRWRMIILSPEEEDEIAAQLAGPGWYQAVGEIISQDGPSRLVPTSDWRYAWVSDTLRKLESTIPVLQREHELGPEWLGRGTDDLPLPPPAEHPLRPRPRASEYLRWFVGMVCNNTVQPVPHAIFGPPYSLLVVDQPGAFNAFSYGFGPDGGGGVVVYSGFLDDILSKRSSLPLPDSPPPQEQTSWLSSLLGSIVSLSPPPPRHPTPTPEQTSDLAILLAHELSHLILSHHLETLSSGTVIIPGAMSMAADVVRALLFPITMVFGPFVNDAVAQLGRVGSGELIKIGEYCTNMKQEIEADVVSARLLAHAGFDARQAVNFWANRQNTANTAECASATAQKHNPTPTGAKTLAHRIMGSSHPVNEVRVERLKQELLRWETEKHAVLSQMQSQQVAAV